jgi:hypothetical protein
MAADNDNDWKRQITVREALMFFAGISGGMVIGLSWAFYLVKL